MTDGVKTKCPPANAGWYYALSDDGPSYGPFETEEIARDVWWDESGEEEFMDAVHEATEINAPIPDKDEFIKDYEHIGFMQRPTISADIFKANHVLEEFEERNEHAVWYESPPDWKGSAKRELEEMLAGALLAWAEKHDQLEEFRSLY